MLRTIVKRLALSTGIAAVILGGWIWSNTAELSTTKDLRIQEQFRSVPEHQNLFAALTYLEDEKFIAIESDSDAGPLMEHVQGIRWDSNYVESLLGTYGTRLDELEVAMQRPNFQSGPPDWRYSATIPAYQHYVSLGKLLIIKTEWHQRRGEFPAANDAFRTGLQFSERLRHDENGSLIAYLIGLVILENQLQWVERQLQSDSLEGSQLVAMRGAIDQQAPYEADGFGKAILAEFLSTKVSVADTVLPPFAKRWESYRSTVPWSEGEVGWSDEGGMVFPGLLGFIATVFPGYALHMDDMLVRRANVLRELASQSVKPCTQLKFVETRGDFKPWDALRPGILSQAMDVDDTSAYRQYFSRRCLAQTRVQAIHALLALRQHEQMTGTLPASLTELEPRYLNQTPKDWLSGEPLRYDRDQRWVYSVGVDANDRGGSSDAILVRRCYRNPQCMKQPTFSLVALPSGS